MVVLDGNFVLGQGRQTTPQRPPGGLWGIPGGVWQIVGPKGVGGE
jgi:hypothetical protein